MRLINVALSCQNMALKKWSDAPKMLFMKGVRLPVSPFLPLRDPQGYNRISLSLSGRILKEYRNIVSASKQTPCGIPWGLRNRTHRSARYTNGRDAAQQENQLV